VTKVDAEMKVIPDPTPTVLWIDDLLDHIGTSLF